MNLRRPNFLRDVFVLSLPLAGLLIYLVLAAITSFLNAEVTNFSGYPVRGLRVGNFAEFVREATRPLVDPRPRDWRPDSGFLANEGAIPWIDLRVEGRELDHLDRALPASGKEWVSAKLRIGERFQDVEARHRGQRLDNYFWGIRSWKLQTGKRELVGFQRDLNFTPMEGRLDNHLSNLVGRRLGIPTPQSRLVHFFLNREDQGLFLQEEQVDESFLRRVGQMPGDVFYGDLFVPEEPKRGTGDLFCNPYLWDKKARYNRYPDEFRPHLTKALDLISDPDPESFDELYALWDRDQLVRFFALQTYQGDQHLDRAHNHKWFFDPLTGRFQAIPWNVRMNMPQGQGLETMANRLAEKLVRDPRFLDDVHAVIAQELLAASDGVGTMEEEQLAELEVLRGQIRQHSVTAKQDESYVEAMEGTVRARAATVRDFHERAELFFDWRAGPEGVDRLDLHVRAVASLRPVEFRFDKDPGPVRLFEDRDGDGRVGESDQEIAWAAEGSVRRLDAAALCCYAGRDLRAPYHLLGSETRAAFQIHRQFTRTAFQTRPLLIVRSERDQPAVAVRDLVARRSVGGGTVQGSAGRPDGPFDTTSLRPERLPDPPPPRIVRWAGAVDLEASLELSDRDQLLVEPGTTLRLGPEVSVLLRCKVAIEGLRIRRLDPLRPWGVFALQGAATSGSRLLDCDISGGSEARIGFVDYTGMVSVYAADGVQIRGGTFASNVIGDDTLRFAHCHDLLVDGLTVRDANGDAIDCDLSVGTIQHSFLDHPRNDGIDLMTCRVDLFDVHILGAGDKGVSLGESANPSVRQVVIEQCVTGIGIKDGSDPIVEDSSFSGCETAISAYDKNWRYPGGGRGRLVRCRFEGNAVDIHLDSRSFLQLEDTSPSGRVVLPDGPEEQFLVRRSSTAEESP